MPMKATRPTIGTTAVLLASGADSLDPISVVLSNPSGNSTVYVGGADVLTTTGFAVAAGASFSYDLLASDLLYGIAASDQVVHLIRNRF